MIRAGGLQAKAHRFREARTVADEHRRDDGGGDSVMPADPTIDTSTHALPKSGGAFLDATSPLDDPDEQAALDGSKERGAPERQIALEVRHAFVEVSRGPPERD